MSNSSYGALRTDWSIYGVFKFKTLSQFPVLNEYIMSISTCGLALCFVLFKVKDKDFNTRYLVDAADADKSDFIRYINSAMTKKSANMDVAQYNGDIFYEVKHAIPAGIKDVLCCSYHRTWCYYLSPKP